MKVTALMSINRCRDGWLCKSSSLVQSWLGWRERVFVYPCFWPCPTARGALLARSKPKVESSTRKARCCVSGHRQTAGRCLCPVHPITAWPPAPSGLLPAGEGCQHPRRIRPRAGCGARLFFSSCHRNRRRPLKHRGGVHV